MDEQEYEKFMTYLYNEYVRTRSRRLHKHLEYELGHALERLNSASNLLRYINHQCRDEEEIYRTITQKRISQLLDEVRSGVRENRCMLEESGFIDAIDVYYDEIIEGMKFEHMPQQEIEIMRRLGSSDPEAELSAIMYIVKSRRKTMRSYNQEISVSSQLKDLEDKLEQQEKQLQNLKGDIDEHPKKSKRWFKGLGQIAQGSALSIANIALAMSVIPIPVAAETAGWGAIVSSITGVGMVLNGIGEFRGE